jgi:hypothetical protein
MLLKIAHNGRIINGRYPLLIIMATQFPERIVSDAI